jgi:hypothetical protein
MAAGLKARLLGLLLIGIGVGFAWFYGLRPLDAARAGACDTLLRRHRHFESFAEIRFRFVDLFGRGSFGGGARGTQRGLAPDDRVTERRRLGGALLSQRGIEGIDRHMTFNAALHEPAEAGRIGFARGSRRIRLGGGDCQQKSKNR